MEILKHASSKPKPRDSNTLVCNSPENAEWTTKSVDMARDQTKNAICHVRRTLAEPAVPAGETVCLRSHLKRRLNQRFTMWLIQSDKLSLKKDTLITEWAWFILDVSKILET